MPFLFKTKYFNEIEHHQSHVYFTFEELRGKYQGQTNLIILKKFVKVHGEKQRKETHYHITWEIQFTTKQQHFVKLHSFKWDNMDWLQGWKLTIP